MRRILSVIAVVMLMVTAVQAQNTAGRLAHQDGYNVFTKLQTFAAGVVMGAGTFSYSRTRITASASNVTLPGNGTLRGIRVKAPSTNTQTIYIDMNATATTASFPLQPGESFDLPCNTSTVSAITASGSQNVDFTAFYN